MADRGAREGPTRRQSFRKSLAEAGLPPEYLDALEQKRKQLDESIHKYIAAKERDYKSYEKELRQQYSIVQDKDREGGKTRRTSSESTTERGDSPKLLGQQRQQTGAVDLLLSAGIRREHIGQPVAVAVREHSNGAPSTIETKAVAGLTDRRASIDRDKEFVGVFTPTFLPALEEKTPDRIHVGSAPTGHGSTSGRIQAQSEHGVQRANSDSLADCKNQRPAHLQLSHRTSSSGSSADGKLASALKSPTQQQPKRKRVSIAVGDTIVAPSDNVPLSVGSNSTPSHSRNRSPAPVERESKPTKAVESLRSIQNQPLTSSSSSESTAHKASDSTSQPDGKLPGSESKSSKSLPAKEKREQTSSLPIVPKAAHKNKPPPKIDPDGDLFDLEDDEDTQEHMSDALESDDEITGRIDSDGPRAQNGEIYDRNAGLIPERSESPSDAEAVEFVPSSVNASQQPTNPGFRRPSVNSDPVYVGANYAEAENDAVVNDVYGSSYARPSKGSFTSGSMGESFMARNAEMIRNRNTRESTPVES